MGAKRADGIDTHRWNMSPGQFCVKAEAKASRLSYSHEDVHAAIFNYLSGRADLTLESQLLSFVEGIERTVQIFETANGYGRKVLTGPKHAAFTKRLKNALRSAPEIWHGLNTQEREATSSFLKLNPNMTLLDRTKRMTGRYEKWWADYELKMLGELNRTIKMRNDIVHGKTISDYDGLFREKQRSKLLLEKLLLCLLGTPSLLTSYEESMFANREYEGNSVSHHSF